MTYVISDLFGYDPEKLAAAFEKAGMGESDTCYVLGNVIDYGENSVELLQYLMENVGKVLTREQIFSHVWDTEFGDIGTVAVNIKSIRDKIDPDNKYIKTVWGVGYKFINAR